VEAEARDAALQLRRCRGGSLQGKRRKTAKTFWMGAHSLGEFIIDVAGQRTGRIGIERIETYRGEREYLEIDPRLVYVGDPAGAFPSGRHPPSRRRLVEGHLPGTGHRRRHGLPGATGAFQKTFQNRAPHTPDSVAPKPADSALPKTGVIGGRWAQVA
jgi:hypothetical protein